MDFCLLLGKNIGKYIKKNLSGKQNQKLLDRAKQSAIDAFKTASKRAIQQTVEATDDMTGNKRFNKITEGSKNLPKNNSETVKNEHDKEIPKERYISSEERQRIIDEMRLI